MTNTAGALFSGLFLHDYLHLLSDEFHFALLEDYVMAEPKIGIGRSRVTKTAEDSMLYQIEMKRLKNLNFLVDYSGLDLAREGLLKLGGEGKPAAFKKVEKIRIQAPQLQGNYFKLYFATPAVFAQGWLPGWIDETTLVGTYGGLKLRLLTACLGRYEPIGGFDMGKKRPKPLRRGVPPGVSITELLDGNGGYNYFFITRILLVIWPRQWIPLKRKIISNMPNRALALPSGEGATGKR